MSECTYELIWEVSWRWAGVQVDRLSSVILSPHFLQTTLAYTPDLERLAA